MVTALLRALGFDDEAEAPPGGGQDRAPVGRGQDRRVGVGAASADVNQNTDLGLSRAEAAVACGPAAAVELARRYGDNIPVDAVIAAARQNGWRSPDGMSTGPQGFARTMRQLGYDVTVADLDASGQGPGWQQTQAALAGGQSVAIDTPGHYYQATAYDPAQGYRLGDTVGAGRYYQPGDIGGIAGGRYGAPRNAIIATPGAGAQARTAGQNGPPPGQPAPGPASIQRIAMNAGANPDLAEIMAAGAKTENPSLNPQAIGDQGHSVGLWQMHDQGEGAGMSVQDRADPSTAAQRMVPAYQQAYERGQRQGYQGTELAVYTYLQAEKPRDSSIRGGPAEAMRTNYAEVTARSSQGHELYVGGTYAPPSGAPGQANAQAPSGPLQQAWEAAQTGIQQLLANLGGAAEAAGGAVAGLGATPAYAQTSGPAGPPPGPTPQVQQPPRSPEDINRGMDAMLTPGAQAVGDAASAVGTAVNTVAAPLGQSVANIGRPSQAQQAAQAARPPPPAPAGPAAPGTPLGQALDQARRAAASQAAPPGPPSTAPAAAIAQTTPPTGTPGQGPDWGTSPGPVGPQPGQTAPSGLPPDTATETWDNRLRAWVPKQHPDFPGGGHFRLTPGVEAATEDVPNPAGGLGTTRPAPNPPGTPVEYIPNQAGYYDTPQGRQYFDSTTQQWHQPTGQAAQGQTAAVPLAPGLNFIPSSPNSRSGMVTWADPNTGAISQAPYTLGDPMPSGLGQPQQAPLTANQQATNQYNQQSLAQSSASEAARLAESIRSTDLSNANERERLAQQADQFAQTMAARQAEAARPYTDRTAQERYQSGIPTRVGGDLYGPDPNNPDPNAPPVNLGPASQTPGDVASTAYTQAQTNRLTQESTLPEVRGNRLYTPVANPDTGVSSYQDSGPVPMSASEQAQADERAREFGTLSAYQQSQADQSKASLAQNESQFQQKLAEQRSEADKPYQQMTKAEQARVGIEQAQLGLDTQKLGLAENQAANQLEQLPRGGIMRVDPFTGQSSLINAPEPEAVSSIGGMIYIPGGRQVSVGGHMVSGGPNPYAGVPTGGGGMFQYPGAQGGQQSPYQNWGGQGGGGWGGGGMSSSPGWQQPRQQQGWMGSGY